MLDLDFTPEQLHSIHQSMKAIISTAKAAAQNGLNDLANEEWVNGLPKSKLEELTPRKPVSEAALIISQAVEMVELLRIISDLNTTDKELDEIERRLLLTVKFDT